jgi:hypothetical protein
MNNKFVVSYRNKETNKLLGFMSVKAVVYPTYYGEKISVCHVTKNENFIDVYVDEKTAYNEGHRNIECLFKYVNVFLIRKYIPNNIERLWELDYYSLSKFSIEVHIVPYKQAIRLLKIEELEII